MPSKAEHVAKAQRNAAFAHSIQLQDQASIDWALIALFYAAVHYIEAYLAILPPQPGGQHVRSHTTRDNWVGRDSNLKRIYSEYRDLKHYGYNARYEMDVFTPSDVTDVATQAINTIQTHLGRLL